MTTIRTTCVDCGEIEIPIEDIAIELASGSRSGSYQFSCPSCGLRYRRPASGKVIGALIASGAAQAHRAGTDPITEEEIAEFATSLGVDEWNQIFRPDDADD